MHLPTGLTEAEVLQAIEDAVRILAPHFTFPGWGVDDVAQEGRLLALQALPKYEPRLGPDGKPTRPLANFVYRHVKYRLINTRRNLYRRADPPCKQCHASQDHPPTPSCEVYARWKERNDRKADLQRAVDPVEGAAPPLSREDVESDAQVAELLARVDAELPAEVRRDWLMLRAGVKLSKARRAAVEEAVREVLGEALDPSPR